MRFAFFVILSAATALAQWQMQESHTKESLRGVSAVDENVVWASGTHGTYLQTTDGGKSWAAHQVSGAEELDFRGVKAFGAEAFLLAAGPGEKSRIYHTTDFGKHWELQFKNSEPKGFLDCMAFSDSKHGVIVGDPVNGRFQILRTTDSGKSWRYADPKGMPAAIEGEGAFAASNTCIAIYGENAWFMTGGSAARVFHSSDGGENWSVTETPIVHGAASQGIFSVAFKDTQHGVIAGGDYAHPDQGGNNLAMTTDGGKTWKLATFPQTRFFSGISYVDGTSLVMVGSGVTAFLSDSLRTWRDLTDQGFNTVDSKDGTTYAAGANGSIARFWIPTRLR
ncbi:MAG TPA: YCF48-related protein [Terriglobales bacterium]|jgi:photosystem II stability/assembly factor-like uncharacterized protein